MSESSDRLARTRLAIIEEVQRRQENRSSLGERLRSMVGMGRREASKPSSGAGSATVTTTPAVITATSGVTATQPMAAPKPESAPSAQERVAATPAQAPHEAAAAQMRAAAADREEAQAEANPDLPGNDPASRRERRAQRLFGGRFAGLGDAGREYWKHHPAHLALELATPFLTRYAQRQPAAYLAVAAAAGALIYVLRPWRLLSVSGLAIAALRSPQISGALIDAVWGKGDDTAS